MTKNNATLTKKTVMDCDFLGTEGGSGIFMAVSCFYSWFGFIALRKSRTL